jgi:hypothetical protein
VRFEILDLSGAGDISSPRRGDSFPRIVELRWPLDINGLISRDNPMWR